MTALQVARQKARPLREAWLGRVRPAVPAALAAGVAGLLAALAWRNHRRAQEAERRSPPLGRFVEVDGVRLHYLERGRGDPLVLLHGNGSMIEDFLSSGREPSCDRRRSTRLRP